MPLLLLLLSEEHIARHFALKFFTFGGISIEGRTNYISRQMLKSQKLKTKLSLPQKAKFVRQEKASE